jgi:putative selenium metabolism hydrolase
MNPLEKLQQNRDKIAAKIASYEPDIVQFMRDLIAIPAESCQEGPVIQRIKKEMEKVGFDEITIDPMGNILGRIGSGKHVIMFDSHTDTVGVGDRKEWKWDPYKGKVEDGFIYGRGACDQRAGMVSMVYAGKAIKELGLEGDYTFYAVGTVQEEDCDGLAWIYILREGKIKPECVVVTEPTDLHVYRGHRGRMEIEVHLRGVSCHASAPERGDNPVYKMTKLVQEIEQLNTRLKDDAFLGKGTIAVTDIRAKTPSLCAVPSSCTIHLDRRLTAGETKESAVAEVKALPGAKGAEVEILTYEVPSYTGLKYGMEKYYPTWVLEESHPAVQGAVEAYKALHGKMPVVDKWVFSTNGVGTMGTCGVPTVGFGPGDEVCAHTVNERMAISHLLEAAKFYAAFPLAYCATVEKQKAQTAR